MPMKVPSVRVVAICDEAIPSEDESEIFTLANTRFYAVAESFPHVQTLNVYLLLFCDQPGNYAGSVQVVRQSDERVIRHVHFRASFDGSWEFVAKRVEIEWCIFTEPGFHRLHVKFMDAELDEHTRADSQITLFQGEEEG
ncbi:MAG: hypothetical protein K2W96_26905 [Gemmataceae bacterium]|nr:hypothetical protein [Gemmataceae bacterium]